MYKDTIKLTSSMIKSGSHDPEAQTCKITFNNGVTHEYTGVSEKLWDDFLMAESVGKFFAANIKPLPNKKLPAQEEK